MKKKLFMQLNTQIWCGEDSLTEILHIKVRILFLMQIWKAILS